MQTEQKPADITNMLKIRDNKYKIVTWAQVIGSNKKTIFFQHVVASPEKFLLEPCEAFQTDSGGEPWRGKPDRSVLGGGRPFHRGYLFQKGLNLPDIVRVGHQRIEFVGIQENQELDQKFDVNDTAPILLQVKSVRIML